MKTESTIKAYRKVPGCDFTKVNTFVKAVIINFGKGDIIVENDNFGTRRKYPDFTKGKEKAGLNPAQIVFCGLGLAKILKERYIGRDGNVHSFAELD